MWGWEGVTRVIWQSKLDPKSEVEGIVWDEEPAIGKTQKIFGENPGTEAGEGELKQSIEKFVT